MTVSLIARRKQRLTLALAALCAAAPAWSIDLSQAYQAAFAQDAQLRADRKSVV